MKVGIDAHKKKCVTAIFKDGLSEPEIFEFGTTKEGLMEFEEAVPEGSIVVIESSTTGKTLSMLLSEKYDVHMVSPPERKPQVKTDKKDAIRIVKEDELGYLKRCYVPSSYIEGLRKLVAVQMELGSKISEVKNQIHSLIERNMMQDAFDGISDIFGVKGLEKLSTLDLPEDESKTLKIYLEELNLYVKQHRNIESDIAGIAISDPECRLLMTIPGMGTFSAVAIKARIGDIHRFQDKKRLCSYAGLVPRADNSGEYVSTHRGLKHGDDILKVALTTSVRGAVKARASTSVKRVYMKQIKRGKAPQDALVIAARKLACIVWSVLINGKPYIEEDKYLTMKKMEKAQDILNRKEPTEENMKDILDNLKKSSDILSKYADEKRDGKKYKYKRGIKL